MAFSYARRPGARSDKKERHGGLPRLIVEVLLIACEMPQVVRDDELNVRLLHLCAEAQGLAEGA